MSTKTLSLKPKLSTKEMDDLQLKHTPPMVTLPKQPSYQDLEQKAVAAGMAKLEEQAPEWRRLRRSAGFTD